MDLELVVVYLCSFRTTTQFHNHKIFLFKMYFGIKVVFYIISPHTNKDGMNS